jgi:hypothetical protein
MTEPAESKDAFGQWTNDPDEKISRRQFMAEKMTDHLLATQGSLHSLDVFMVREAISSTAIEHPEWDMDGELHTRAQWPEQDWPASEEP